jgi:hypothetical protein
MDKNNKSIDLSKITIKKESDDKSINLSKINTNKNSVDKSINMNLFFNKTPQIRENVGRPKKYLNDDDRDEKRKEYKKLWYEQKKNDILKKNKEYKKNHEDEIKIKNKEYYAKNKSNNEN